MIKHLLVEVLTNMAQYAAMYLAVAAVPFALSVLKKAKLKTQSKAMASLYSIASDVVTDLQPEVDKAKEDGKFTREEAIKIKDRAVKDMKSLLRKEHNKLIRNLIGDVTKGSMLENVLGKLIEKVVQSKTGSNMLPDKFMGIHFDWKF